MKTLVTFIHEALSNEIIELQKQMKQMDKSRIFNGKYILDDSLPNVFYNMLTSLNGKNPSDTALKNTWRMLFSKLVIEPLVAKIIGEQYCSFSTIAQDREEKWDIKYKNVYLDIKATYNGRTHNFSLPKSDAAFIQGHDYDDRYLVFMAPEVKTWNDGVRLYKNKNEVQLYSISYSDMKEELFEHDFDTLGNVLLITESYIENSNKFRKVK